LDFKTKWWSYQPIRFFVQARLNKIDFSDSNDYDFSSNYASHLWNTFNNKRMREYTADIIFKANFTLARILIEAIDKGTSQKILIAAILYIKFFLLPCLHRTDQSVNHLTSLFLHDFSKTKLKQCRLLI
jgi:hypothetical protein